ncbi:family 16 glycosylhydrolase [Algisphaera agarilytica]|uniref:Beta-glucanase (GH16 family) n=1 Tax=Algisphaera agarilytica TaxID=1385975 RepID=A0A7X0H7Q8_9BACT|nr:family 16 glycosylhydrolase [Algisphaera agarilytica]MBB6429354.1 beta-glucanase (GH16 family) [Algisphaera agarilytica]
MLRLGCCLWMLALVGCAQVQDGPAWELVFAEEGDGEQGAAPDPAKWVHDIGGWGWGNQEPQTYTPGNDNAFYDGNGMLIIEARRENRTGEDGIAAEFTSARIKTQGIFSQRYGRIEGRLKLPEGQGIWPAFWMLGDTITSEGWPACGEIDIMELLGHKPHEVHGTLHGPGYSAGAGLQGSYHLADGGSFADGFHVYAVEWEPKEIRWYVDGELYHTRTPEDAGLNEWAFEVPHFVILNIAVGGAWPGYPDETTQFPQQMLIDYVRVYRDQNLAYDDAELAAYHEARKANHILVEQAKLEAVLEPKPIPGVVQAAHFRPGGEGVGYHDADAANQGSGAFRQSEGVDLGYCSQEGVDFSVGWTSPGEWLAYDLDVQQAGKYQVTAHVACKGPGGVLQLDLNGQPIGEAAVIPDTGDWQNWQTVSLGVVELEQGAQVLRLTMPEGSAAGVVGNVSQLVFEIAE